jgi:chloride channel 3/4/5
VHIATCVAYLVGMQFPKYRDNGRKLREVLAAGCASGLSVAFGAPIGGVLFAYEEISTYFPRKVLWRAFICSLFAAMTLRALNPTGTGRLVLFETKYGSSYKAVDYPVFVFLGIAGGVFGGVFCKLNFIWARWFRKYAIIKGNPVFEVFLVVLATALLQYPNPLTREPGDVIIKNLLVDCSGSDSDQHYVCVQEHSSTPLKYQGWLIYGTLVKLVLTIITFGIKVPSGIIIPALDGGAFFGRLVGQLPFLSSTISPGIFAMVGAGAFLAGVSRMTISLAVIMFELTGELEFIVPNMIGIMVAKWVADALEKEGVYDLAQTVLGHPFLDLDASMLLVQKERHLVEELIPPTQTMKEITVEVHSSGVVPRALLAEKLHQLQRRGLMDAGLVLVAKANHMLLGYLAEGELEFGLTVLGENYPVDVKVRLLAPTRMQVDPTVDEEEEELDLSQFIDRTPLTLCATAPMEYAVEMFGKLGLRYLMVTEEGSAKLIGVIIKKRLVSWLDGLKHEE